MKVNKVPNSHSHPVLKKYGSVLLVKDVMLLVSWIFACFTPATGMKTKERDLKQQIDEPEWGKIIQKIGTNKESLLHTEFVPF